MLRHSGSKIQECCLSPDILNGQIGCSKSAMTSSRALLSVQPFGRATLGGGQRILRTLFEQAPMKVVVCNTAPGASPTADEYIIRRRMYFGRLEQTRIGFLFEPLSNLCAPFFKRRLEHLTRELGITDVHAIAHDVEFVHAFDLTQKLNLPFHLTVHDDAQFLSKGRSFAQYVARRLPEVWLKATSVFVISKEMGEEYCKRYGRRDYQIVTDGVDEIAKEARPHRANQLSIYFMGLFLYHYRDNLILLLQALDALNKKHPQANFTVKLRCGAIPHIDFSQFKTPVNVLESTLDTNILLDEMGAADLLYLPLQFGDQFADFTKFSLSTKLVSYCASGVPILYHGPEFAAAGQLLQRQQAALLVPNMNPEALERALEQALTTGGALEATNALALANDSFRKEVCRRKFWTAILGESHF